jgi:hypothetical protein
MGIKYDKQTCDYIAFLQGNAYDYPPFRWVENKVSVNMWSEKTIMYEVWVQDGPKPKYEHKTIKEFAHVGKRWWVNAPEWVKNAPFFESSVRQYRMSKIIDKLNEFRAKNQGTSREIPWEKVYLKNLVSLTIFHTKYVLIK